MSSVSAKPPVAAAHPHDVESPNGPRNDDYYWLRDDTRTKKEMLDYLAAENGYTDAVLAHTKPLQEKIYNEIVGRIKQDDASVPFRKRGYWYYRRFETVRNSDSRPQERISRCGRAGTARRQSNGGRP